MTINRNTVFTVAVLLVAAGVFFANCGVQRLPNGNTVVSWYGGNPQFFEITPEKKGVWQAYDKRLSAISGLFLLNVKGDATKGEVLK